MSRSLRRETILRRQFKEGQEVGPYTLLEFIGQGGLAEVWLAEQGPLKLQRALKIPTNPAMDEAAIVREADIWKRAGRHKNIVQILDACVYKDVLVIASEYHADGNLVQWLEQRGGKAPSVEEAIRIVVEILNGLNHLHTLSEPVVHRDIKPANILFDGNIPRIADFGLARSLDATHTQVSGTPLYMAPEAFRNARTIQTDVWSCGVVFYELLSGRRPFPNERAIMDDPPNPLPREVPQLVRNVVLQVLQKDPSCRYQTAAEFQTALEEIFKEIQKADDYFTAGKAHLKEQKYDEAIREFDKVIERRPKNAEAYVCRGEAYRHKNELDRSMEDLNEAISINPAFAAAYCERGRTRGMREEWDLAVSDLSNAIGLDPDDAPSYALRALIYGFGLDKIDLALVDINRAIELRPEDVEVYMTRGRLSINRAIADFKKVTELAPEESAKHKKASLELEKLKGGRQASKQNETKTQAAHESSYESLGCIAMAVCIIGLASSLIYGITIYPGSVEALILAALFGFFILSLWKVTGPSQYRVAKLKNSTSDNVSFQLRVVNALWESKTLEPGEHWTIWTKNMSIDVKFEPSPGSKEKMYWLIHSQLDHVPNEFEQTKSPLNYFARVNDGNIDLYSMQNREDQVKAV